jgi:hydrophobe/amphiphile efflux-1 (HAE1) family protein
MNISAIFIKRPVLSSVISIMIVLFGIIGFRFLGVREFPSVDPPVVTVSTSYSGANAEVMESQITEPLEESISGIAGIRSLSSTSSDGRSTIVIEFNLGINMEVAANDVRDKVSVAVRMLPPDADPPVVSKSDANAETILSITVQSDRRTLLELTELALNTFKERLQTIEGVSEIRIWGEKKYAMKLEFEPMKLSAYGLTPGDVQQALQRQNVEIPSGKLEGITNELTIRTMGRLTTVDDFNNLIIAERNGLLIRLKDIGNARLAPENERTILRGNGGIPMVGVALTPQPGVNYISIVDEAYKRVEQIKKELPPDIRVGIALDTTRSIRKAITEVEETILLAFILVLLVIFLFLRDWRTTMIPVIAIPISLIGSFFIMYISGFSINILTLLGIVLATGIVVDDAIVVMENIYAKVELGMPAREAAFEGSKEIVFAIISTTITLAVVFLPVIFLQGLTGRLFREFGVVVAGAVLISAVVSLTLTPMMSSKLLRRRENENWLFRKTEPFYLNIMESYHRSLGNFVTKPWRALIVMAVALLIIFVIGRLIPTELAPMEDKSRLRIQSVAPEGTSFEKMDEYVNQVINLVDTMKERESVLAVTSPGFGASVSANSGFVRLSLVPPTQRQRSQDEIATQLSAIVRNMNFARSFVVQEQTIGASRGGLPVQYVIQAPDFESLKSVIPSFLEAAGSDPAFSFVDIDLKFNKPELNITIDRDKAREMGISVMDIAQTIQLFFSGQRYGYFIMNGKQYQVIGQATRLSRDEPMDLTGIAVRNSEGMPVQIENLIEVSYTSASPQLYRYNRYVSATVSAQLAEGYTLGEGIEAMDRTAKKTLNDRFSTSLAGVSKDFSESSGSILFAFLLALILIYLILAAQFESFSDPLIIMLTVPLAIAGAVLTLWMFGHTLNIFSEIGIIVLVGIVTKNGILIVEFANQRKRDGLPVVEAVIDAATRRFRPILMTSIATILGALPIALALGGASTSRIPMGIAIIGGLGFSLILTLYVIPALYIYLTSKKKKVYNEEGLSI